MGRCDAGQVRRPAHEDEAAGDHHGDHDGNPKGRQGPVEPLAKPPPTDEVGSHDLAIDHLAGAENLLRFNVPDGETARRDGTTPGSEHLRTLFGSGSAAPPS